MRLAVRDYFEGGAGPGAVRGGYGRITPAAPDGVIVGLVDGMDNLLRLPYTFSRNLAAYNSKSMSSALANVARTYAYPLGRSRTANAVLVEGARTNLLLRSNTLNTSPWLKANSGTGSAPVVTEGYAADPWGNAAAANRMVLDKGAGTGFSTVYQTLTLSAVAHNCSIWMKSNTGASYTICVRRSQLTDTKYNCLVTPTWQLFVFPFTATAGACDIQLILRNGYSTSDSCDIIVWSPTLEAAAFASSQVISGATAGVRPADIYTADLTGLAGGGLSQTAGTLHLLVEPSTIDQDGATNFVLAADSAGNFSIIRTAAGVLTVVKKDGAGTRTIADAACVFAANSRKLISVVWDATSLRCYVNGVAAGTPVTGLAGAWSTVTNMVIGSAAAGDGSLALFGFLVPLYSPSAATEGDCCALAQAAGVR